jgi:hypothetical protein
MTVSGVHRSAALLVPIERKARFTPPQGPQQHAAPTVFRVLSARPE